MILITWAAARAGPFPFEEADQAFNSGELDRAEQLYQSVVTAPQAQPLALARALEGLAAIYLTRNQDALFRSTMTEVARLRHSQGSRQENPGGDELLVDGGFEQGLLPPWGTGHYESGNFNFGIWWNSKTCRSFAKMDSSQSHSGQSSLRITNFTPPGAHLFGTTSQRIRAISPNTNYEVSLWAKADSLAPGAVQIIVDAGWLMRPLTLPPGSYDWKPFKAQFNSGDLAQIDFRVLSQNQGTVWLDDLSLRRLREDETADNPLLQASALYRRGRVREALELCRGLEKSWADQPPRLHALWTLMAEALAMLGEYAQAVELFEKVKSPNRFPIWMALGEIYLKLGQPDRALEHFRHVYQRATLDQATLAWAADGIAMAQLGLGDLSEATAFESQSLGIMTHINDPHGRATGLCHLGQIYSRAGRKEAARDTLDLALPLARTTGDRQLESDILTQRAQLQASINLALADLSEAVRLRREIFDRYGLLESLYWLGHTQALQGNRQAAIASLREAAEVLESLQHAAGSLSERGTGLLHNGKSLYEELIRLYLESGHREEALELLGRCRNQHLCQLFQKQDPRLDPRQQKLVETHRAMQADRVALERTLQRELSQPQAAQDPTNIADARRQREKNLSDYREFLRNLFQTQPELAGLISVHPKQLRLKQSQLPPESAIVEYLSGEKQLYIFIVTRSALEVRVLELPRKALSQRVSRLRHLITQTGRRADSAALLTESHQLYRDLLGPVENLLTGIRTLHILPNGPLHYLPFQALVVDPQRGEYLVDRMACANLCEESFLASAPQTRTPPKKILLLGNPDGSLAYSEEEVRRIAQLYPGSQVYVGKSARKNLIQSAGQKYQALHIASHGYMDSLDASRSFILLAPDSGDPGQGRLSLREVWGLDLKGLDLVTLSACATGIGEQNPGDEVISLENAFFFAGASSVAASLWDVSDQTTARLMTEFYRFLPRDGAVLSLQKAQQALKKDYPEPYFWAPFILVAPP